MSPAPWLQFIDANGNPYAGGKLYIFFAGTSTPATVYQDSALLIPHANPIILDASGRCTIYLPATGSFLYQLKTAADVLVDDQEPITGPATADLTPLIDASIAWPGSESAALMGAAAPAGSTDAARAPGTGFFTLANPASVNFEATMWAEAGATATVGLYKTTAPDTLVVGSGLTSTHATGELKTIAAPITLAAGTYFIKGHSNHATLQAWAVTYRVSPDT